jgi:beta-N-acetylglucosaminidase
MATGAHAVRGRIAAAVLTTVLVGLSALPASAAGDPAAQVAQAQQRLNDAKQKAAQADSTLGAAQQNLAAAQARLADLTHQVAALDATIATDDATVARFDAQEKADKQQLGAMLRTSYEHGLDSPLLYVLGASDLSTALQRQGNLSHISDKSKQLMQHINDARSVVQKARDDATTQRAALAVAQQQATATAELVSIEEQKLQIADVSAWTTVDQSKAQLADAVKAKKLYDQQQAALAAAAALAAQKQKNTVFPPVPGVVFTVDTDLTLASGESADRLNSFLQGTALQGLGGALMSAEQQYHVSARYLLAHAIEESAWGTSRIAQDKHNLYGYGARAVAKNYLSPSGPFYHGPTLRGMNVNYASDPYWAENIARIGRSIP